MIAAALNATHLLVGFLAGWLAARIINERNGEQS
ncbi:Uncharacterised protein [Mycolicibacterium aurum]|uniref:Uncharacterized protein n=1 Tax=Mycolicibacterium aurum TaxID=1791 RepID=A0A3S4S3S9_MYCAU|nr:Uncharacterised protein [Mycolicibacterium aurum]